jgi:hypothetical protein
LGSPSGRGRGRRRLIFTWVIGFTGITSPAFSAPACFLFVEIDRSIAIQNVDDAGIVRIVGAHGQHEATSA